MLPVVVLLPGHGAVSGYLLCKLLSTSSLFCWADCFGFDVPLATVTEPVEFGLTRMIVSVSWLATVQPVGSGTVAAAEHTHSLRTPTAACRTPGRTGCRQGSMRHSWRRCPPSISSLAFSWPALRPSNPRAGDGFV